jgi:hypothetical protein
MLVAIRDPELGVDHDPNESCSIEQFLEARLIVRGGISE